MIDVRTVLDRKEKAPPKDAGAAVRQFYVHYIDCTPPVLRSCLMH